MEEGHLEIRRPLYQGVPLPFSAKLEIKRSSFPPGSGDFVEYHFAHAYLAKDMVGEMMVWDHNVEDRGTLSEGEGSPRLNANLTKLSRCNFNILLCYIKARILASKDSFKALRRDCAKVSYGNPFDRLVSTLISAGFTYDINKYIGADLIRRLETTSTFDLLNSSIMESKLELFNIILPDDDWSYNLPY